MTFLRRSESVFRDEVGSRLVLAWTWLSSLPDVFRRREFYTPVMLAIVGLIRIGVLHESVLEHFNTRSARDPLRAEESHRANSHDDPRR
jgi:hypothetical protein